jgi:hypothetical protein
MRRLAVLPSIVVVMLLSVRAVPEPSAALAQEATPAVADFMPEGITFEPMAFATGLALPSTGEVSVARISLEPGVGFEIDEGDPTYALAIIESGELTIRLNGVLTITRAEAFVAAMDDEAAGEVYTPATEMTTAGQEVALQAGDTALFPPKVSGEVGNNGQERAVAMVVFMGPPEDITGEATPVP